jgi:hypothetical protein
MKFKYNKSYRHFIIVLFSLLVFSCKKFIQIDPAPNLIQSESVFANDKTALAASISVYTQMNNLSLSATNAGMSIYGGLLSDEVYNTTSSASYDPFYLNSLLQTDASINSNFWSNAYKILFTVNSNIEGIAKSKALNDSLAKQLLGEMLVVRAFNYFYLVNLYGDVPLVMNTDYRVNAVMPRIPVPQVYQQIIADLIDAQGLLKNTYPSSGKARPNKWTGTALLSRVYLYQRQWANAETQSTSLISSNIYSLVGNLNTTSVFTANSPETIWEIASTNENGNTQIGIRLIPASLGVKPDFALTNTLLSSFESGDLRKLKWVDSNKIGTPQVAYYYPRKYKERLATVPVKEYNIIFRLAEQYLIRAEARAQQNNLTGAIADLNILRTRAGLPILPNTLTQVEVLAAVAQERKIELFAEWGHRWLDLKRTGRADAVLGSIKSPNWQTTDVLFPIYLNDLHVNPFLTQNAGY